MGVAGRIRVALGGRRPSVKAMSEQLSMTSSHTKDAALPLLNQLEKSLAKFIGAEAHDGANGKFDSGLAQPRGDFDCIDAIKSNFKDWRALEQTNGEYTNGSLFEWTSQASTIRNVIETLAEVLYDGAWWS
jgi:hypothetical protein